jgi:aminoglycoside phosphotransferase (APT) family kinase protein
LVTQFATLLAQIHARSSESQRLLANEFSDRSFFESLRIEPYYSYAAAQIPAAAPFAQQLIDETRRRNDALVHGDYSPKNILIHAGHITLLDHEVIHWGEPAFDIGFSLAHFLSKANYLTIHRAIFAAAANEYWRAYREALGQVAWGNDLEQRSVRHTLGCLLARVVGRSQLEYLNPGQRRRQAAAVLTLLDRPPNQIKELIERFIDFVDLNERD